MLSPEIAEYNLIYIAEYNAGCIYNFLVNYNKSGKKKHLTNISVVNFFKHRKSVIKDDTKVGRAVEALFSAITADYKRLKLATPKVQTKKRGPKINEPDDWNSEESWNKRKVQKKSPAAYQNGKRLKKLYDANEKTKTLEVNRVNGTIGNENYYYFEDAPRPFMLV